MGLLFIEEGFEKNDLIDNGKTQVGWSFSDMWHQFQFRFF